MRNLAVCLVFGLVGCIEISDPDALPPGGDTGGDTTQRPIDTSHAHPCQGSAVLDGFGNTAPHSITLPPNVYDTAGMFVCIELDARQNIQVAHFAADTDREVGETSSYQLALFDKTGTMLLRGWDVAYGAAPDTNVFANLEYGVTKGQDLMVQLFVATKAGTATTAVGISLFEPYE